MHLQNLLTKPAEEEDRLRHAQTMVSFKLLPCINLLVAQNNGDEEARADAEFIQGKLNDCFEHMSSFDEYANEVRQGKLDWTPVHRSEKFWRDNADRLNENKYELIKKLVTLLETSSDPQV